MTITTHHSSIDDRDRGDVPEGASDLGPPASVEVRRNAGLLLLVGAAASGVAIAFLYRAIESLAVLDWTLCLVLAAVGIGHLAALVDSRTPLLVADELGVRVRFGRDWRGLPWGALARVVVASRGSATSDGRLVLVPRDLGHAIDGIEGRARRSLVMAQKLYGAPLALPLGMTTRVRADRPLVDALVALADGRADVVVVTDESRESLPGDAITLLPPRAGEDESDGDLADVVDLGATLEEAEAANRPEPEPEPEREAPEVEEAQVAEPAAPHVALLPEDLDDEDSDGPGSHDVVGSEDPVASGTDFRVLSRIFGDTEPARTETELAPVDERDPTDGPEHTDDTADAEASEEQQGTAAPDVTAPRRTFAEAIGNLGVVVSRVGKRREQGGSPPGSDPAPEERQVAAVSTATDEALASRQSSARVEITHRPGDRTDSEGATALDRADDDFGVSLLPEGAALRPGNDREIFEQPRWSGEVRDDSRVRPIAKAGNAVAALVLGDYETRPAYDPVIGPEIRAARTRLGLGVDELAERTRIRPHVIESIEVDDFAPCGGDFYARGHLRTLARLLGKDGEAMVATFDERYATGTVNARRIFEAELATGMTGSMRGTRGGPHWGLVMAVVVALALVWGAARLFVEPPVEVYSPAPLPGVSSAAPVTPEEVPVAPAAPVPLQLMAARGDATVTVRDSTGTVVFSGDLALGQQRRMKAVLPVRITASDGGAVEVRVDGEDRGVLGVAGQPAKRKLG